MGWDGALLILNYRVALVVSNKLLVSLTRQFRHLLEL